MPTFEEEMDALPDAPEDDFESRMNALPDADPGATTMAPNRPAPAPLVSREKPWWEALTEHRGDASGRPYLGAAPTPGSLGAETTNDTAVGIANGATLGMGDEALSALAPQAGRQWADRIDLARSRSPTGFGVGNAGAQMAAGAMVPGGVAAQAAMGAASGFGNADGASMQDRGYAALEGLATGTAGGATGKLLQGAGRGLQAGAGAVMREGTVPNKIAQGAGDLAARGVAGFAGHQVGGWPGALVGMTAEQAVSPLVQQAAPGAIAGGLRAAGAGMRGTGMAAGPAGVAAGGQLAQQFAPAQTTVNQLPQIVIDELHAGGDALGEYADQFAKAYTSNDEGAVSALVSKLTLSDPKFRTTLLPQLRAAVGKGR